MRLILFFLLFSVYSQSQTIHDCKKRFERYLNFKNSLNDLVKFDGNDLVIYNQKGQKEFTAYHKEIPMLAEVFEHYSLKDQIAFYKFKGNKKLNKRQRDSIWIYLDEGKKVRYKSKSKPLTGYKIALDPGHMAGSFTEAMNEQKYLYFVKDSINHPLDTVKIYEAELTYKTAQILKTKLEEEGASVFITRKAHGLSAFGCSYPYWFVNHKERVLDSLLLVNKLEAGEVRRLKKLNDYKFFWDFFRDYELYERARIINQFQPHLSVIIHYNVDDKNIPWKKTSNNNFTMAFIGGVFTKDKLDNTESKLNFLRLLFSRQLNESEKLSSETVEAFHKQLDIPYACSSDADYLTSSCIPLESEGVFSRGLILCNKINSPLVYGESLFQDNAIEVEKLMKNDVNVNGIITNERVLTAALCYYNGIKRYLRK